MKFRIIALVFALSLFSLLSLAQTASQPAASTEPTQATPAADAKPGCACCKAAMAGDKNKEMAGCCHDMKDGKCDMAACKDGKTGESCMKADKGKETASAATEGGCCKHGDGKGCSMHEHNGDKTAMNCCGSHCDRKGHSHEKAGM